MSNPARKAAPPLALIPTLVVVSALALLALIALAPSRAQATASPAAYYVSLGDSLSVGVQPNRAGKSVETPNGYADKLYSIERKRIRGLRLTKLGCGGETTSTLLDGGICSYRGDHRTSARGGRGKQLAAAEAFLRSHRGQIAFITIDIGANDVDRCAHGTQVDLNCVNAGISKAAANAPKIAKRLRAAAGKRTRIIVMSYYDPFLELYFTSARGLAQPSVALGKSLNDKITAAFTAVDGRVADVFAAFESEDQTPVAYKGQQVPRNVVRICQLTWMCAASPVGPNIHANASGYRLIARTFAGMV